MNILKGLLDYSVLSFIILKALNYLFLFLFI